MYFEVAENGILLNIDDFGFKKNSRTTIDFLLYGLRQSENIVRGRAFSVDNEVGVLFGNLRASDTKALKTGFFDQCARKGAFGMSSL